MPVYKTGLARNLDGSLKVEVLLTKPRNVPTLLPELDVIRSPVVNVPDIALVSEIEGTTGSGTAQGVITNINITSAGTNYKVGDTVTITGGGGQDAAARVSQIGTGAITGFTIFDGGDGYVNTAVLTVNNFATGGTGVSGDVSNIAHTFTFSINEDIIGNFTTVVFNDANYNLSGQETTLRTTRLVDAFGFSALQIGSIANVRATGLGSGYELSPIISIVQDNIVKFNDPAVGIINLNDDPDSISETNAISGTFTTGERITSNSVIR